MRGGAPRLSVTQVPAAERNLRLAALDIVSDLACSGALA